MIVIIETFHKQKLFKMNKIPLSFLNFLQVEMHRLASFCTSSKVIEIVIVIYRDRGCKQGKQGRKRVVNKKKKRERVKEKYISRFNKALSDNEGSRG